MPPDSPYGDAGPNRVFVGDAEIRPIRNRIGKEPSDLGLVKAFWREYLHEVRNAFESNNTIRFEWLDVKKPKRESKVENETKPGRYLLIPLDEDGEFEVAGNYYATLDELAEEIQDLRQTRDELATENRTATKGSGNLSERQKSTLVYIKRLLEDNFGG